MRWLEGFVKSHLVERSAWRGADDVAGLENDVDGFVGLSAGRASLEGQRLGIGQIGDDVLAQAQAGHPE